MQEWEYVLLKNVVKKLPEKYSFLLEQISTDFILDSVPNEFLNKGWKRTLLDENLFRSLKNNSINYQLTGIVIYDLKSDWQKMVELDLNDGVLIGYRVQEGQYDFDRIDITNLREYDFSTIAHDSKYIEFLREKKTVYLDLHGGFEIQRPGKNYYVIKDFQDGNYLSIDDLGKVYGMFHDPFLIELIHENVGEFIDQVNAGLFSIDCYYDSKYE